MFWVRRWVPHAGSSLNKAALLQRIALHPSCQVRIWASSPSSIRRCPSGLCCFAVSFDLDAELCRSIIEEPLPLFPLFLCVALTSDQFPKRHAYSWTPGAPRAYVPIKFTKILFSHSKVCTFEGSTLFDRLSSACGQLLVSRLVMHLLLQYK